ncbi:zinc finger protein 721-like [Culicoides brevitarsis]|uniref:zinc finger protein 721-like n=1 Tax=Culicoides brevitarsis TaxID=469753 RepID=UPI00307B763C
MEIKEDEDLHPFSKLPLPEDKPIPCRHCPRSYKAVNVRDLHERIHLIPYICDYCQQPFALKSHLRNHLEIHRRMINPYQKVKKNQHSLRFKDDASKFTCEYCGKHFFSKLGYTGHLKLKHPEEHDGGIETVLFVKQENYASEEETNDYFSDEAPKKEEETPFTCSCGEIFRELVDLVRHQSSQHTEGFEKMVRELKDLLLYVINRSSDEQVSVPRASKREKKVVVKQEIEENDESQPKTEYYPSENSSESEFEEKKPKIRRKRSSTAKKPEKLQCQYCDKQLSNQRFFEVHVAKKHQNIPVFRCKICNRYFLDEQEFQTHVKGHERDPDLCCSECGFLCKGAAVLRRHVDSKHRNIEQTPRFFCPECNKGFYYKCKLDEHAFIHKPQSERPLLFTCDICQMSFTRKSALVRHKMSHDESTKKYSCTFCAKTFRRKQHLNSHLAMHTGSRAREEICADCGAIYSERRGLYNHMLRVHGRPLEGYKKQIKS